MEISEAVSVAENSVGGVIYVTFILGILVGSYFNEVGPRLANIYNSVEKPTTSIRAIALASFFG